jgi:hypothetical protein
VGSPDDPLATRPCTRWLEPVADARVLPIGADAEPQDHGFMYGWSCYDLDRHGWGVMWMDPNAAQSPDAASVTPAISAPVTLPTT